MHSQIQICRNGCDDPICEDTKFIEGNKKPKSSTLRPRTLTTTTNVIQTSPLSRVSVTRGDVIRTRGPTRVPAVVNQVTDAPTRSRTRPLVLQDDTTQAPRTRVTGRSRGPNVRISTEADEIYTTKALRIRGRTTTQIPETTEFSCNSLESENDPRCLKPSTVQPKQIDVTRFVCTLGSLDPRCPQSTTTKPRTTTVFTCLPGSTDTKCAPDCYPGNQDLRCPQLRLETTTR